MADQMSPDELIRRLREVIRTAVLDSNVVDDTVAATEAERAAGEHDRREAEAVRDEVIAALRRLNRIVQHVEAVDPTEISTYVLAIARGDTTNKENRSEG